MKNIFFALTCTVILLAGCASSERKNYVVLIDNSKSIPEELLDKYIHSIQEVILPNMGNKDKLTVQFIDECSLSKSERVFYLDLATVDFSNTFDGLNNEKDSSSARMRRFINDSIKTEIKRTIFAKRKDRNECGKYTDIITALPEVTNLVGYVQNKQSAFASFLDQAQGIDTYSYENCLIIFSDMINEDPEHSFDFTTIAGLDSKQISEKLAELKSDNKIANLTGVKIFVYGATSSKEVGSNVNKQIENIKLFWQGYFSIAGASINAYGFDTENEIKQYLVSTAYQ